LDFGVNLPYRYSHKIPPKVKVVNYLSTSVVSSPAVTSPRPRPAPSRPRAWPWPAEPTAKTKTEIKTSSLETKTNTKTSKNKYTLLTMEQYGC